MQEFWFCDACKSMNRGDAGRCYKCRAPKAGSTMATVHERKLTDVAMPGVDRLDPSTAAALMTYPYNVAWPIGYVSAVLLALPMMFEIGLVGFYLIQILATFAPGFDPIGSGSSRIWLICFWGYIVSLAVAGLVHSCFLGLTDMNVPSLGGGKPRFGPMRAGAWWIESLGWASRAILGIWIPLLIGLNSLAALGRFGAIGVFGLITGFALIWVSIHFLGYPTYSARKPGRLLDDLTERLALPGSSSGLSSMWSGAWVTARVIDAVSPLVVLGSYLILFFAALFQALRVAGGAAPLFDLERGLTTVSMLLESMMMLALTADAIALFLLIRVTLSLSDSERVRRRWVVESAARASAVVPPAQPAAAVARPAPQPVPASPRVAVPSAAPPVRPSVPPAVGDGVVDPSSIRISAEPAAEARKPASPTGGANPPGEDPRPVLRPSLTAVSRYGPPPRVETPVQARAATPASVPDLEPATEGAPIPEAPIPERPMPLEPDWPEGM